MMPIEQVNVTRNQSTLIVTLEHVFLFGNQFNGGDYKNNTAGEVDLEPYSLVARDVGAKETASFVFNATKLTAGETMIIGGLTYTSTGDSEVDEVALAFAGLADGAVSGQGTALGVYTGKLVGYSTGLVTAGTTVLFTSSVFGPVADLVATGTGAAPAITIVQGVAAVADQLIPITADNLADVIGISANTEAITQAAAAVDNINYGVKGTIAEEKLVFPGGVTLDTSVGNKTLRDVLEDIGFHLEGATENTKSDNV